MFEQSTLSGGPLSARLWSTCAGLTGQAFLVGTMLLVPLMWPAALPNMRNYITLAPPGPPPPPPPPPGETTVRPKAIHTTRICTVCAPVSIPKRVAMIVDDPPEVADAPGVPGGVPGGIAGGVSTGLIGGILDSARPTAPPPPAPVRAQPTQTAAAPAAPIQVRAGGRVQLGAPIVKVEPAYPAIARTARIEGVVELEAIVGVDGRVRELRAKSGPPFLVKAAMDAVRQWIYVPTLLNGQPVEVISPITVTFRIGR